MMSETIQEADWPIKINHLEAFIADNPEDIAAAQRLRYDVFAREMGAKIDAIDGRDIDRYDAVCRHLLVRDLNNGAIVGTYRLITAEAAQAAGGWYSASEFDISNIEHLMPQAVELGRACVHRDYRSGAAITLLWTGLSRFMKEQGLEYMVGCASVSMADGGHEAASLYRYLEQKHFAPEAYRVFPKIPVPLDELRQDLDVTPPALLKGYLRAGVWVCSAPFWDKDFNTADMLVMMPMSRVNPRYAKHFLK